MLNTFTPDLYVGYFRDPSELAASGAMTREGILAVMARYATYLPRELPCPPAPTKRQDMTQRTSSTVCMPQTW